MSVASRALHGINVCLIPSPYNNDRPLVLRHRPLATVSGALLAIKLLAALTLALTPTPAELATITVNRIIQQTNDERAKEGLPALQVSSALTAAAQDKGNHMLEQDYFAHISPTGVTPWFWIQKHGYDYLIAGENLAIDFTEAEDVVAAWMASPSHRANIMQAEYTETGVGVVTGEFQGGTSTVVVHMFGKPQVAAANVTSTPTPSPTPATAGTQQAVTASPSATPIPTATPQTPEPAATPLPAPRIALVGPSPVQQTLTLSVSGIPGSSVKVLVNGELSAETTLTTTTASLDVPVSSFADGQLAVRAYAVSTDGAGASQLSEAVIATKDTTGPEINHADLVFVINPGFDTAQAATIVPGEDTGRLSLVSATGPTKLEATDEHGNVTTLEGISLQPQFDTTLSADELRAPQQLMRMSRQIAGVVLVILLILLITSIVIRVRIQHPALITHATLAILLAAVLFLI